MPFHGQKRSGETAGDEKRFTPDNWFLAWIGL